MPLQTVAEYRKFKPDDQRPDGEITRDLIDQALAQGTLDRFPDLQLEHDYRESLKRPISEEFAAAIASGTDQGQASLYSTAGMFGQLIGSKGIQNWALEGYRRNRAEAGENAPSVATLEDVRNPFDALLWATNAMGSQVPQLGGTIAATAGGALLGSLVGPGGTVAGASAGFNASRAGAALAGFATAAAQQNNWAELVESQGGDTESAAFNSLVQGTIGGALEFALPARLMGRLFRGAPKGTAARYISRVLREVPETAALEGSTEALQELATIASELYHNRNNPDFKLDHEQIVSRLVNNAAAGALVGGIVGGGSALITERGAVQADAETKENILDKGRSFAEAVRANPDVVVPVTAAPTPGASEVRTTTVAEAVPAPPAASPGPISQQEAPVEPGTLITSPEADSTYAPAPITPVIPPAALEAEAVAAMQAGNVEKATELAQAAERQRAEDLMAITPTLTPEQAAEQAKKSSSIRQEFQVLRELGVLPEWMVRMGSGVAEKMLASAKQATRDQTLPPAPRTELPGLASEPVVPGPGSDEIAIDLLGRNVGVKSDTAPSPTSTRRAAVVRDNETGRVMVRGLYVSHDEVVMHQGQAHRLITMKDIASALGVSYPTVKRALTDTSYTSARAENIRRYSELIGYRPTESPTRLREMLKEKKGDGTQKYSLVEFIDVAAVSDDIRADFENFSSYAIERDRKVTQVTLAALAAASAVRTGQENAVIMARINALNKSGLISRVATLMAEAVSLVSEFKPDESDKSFDVNISPNEALSGLLKAVGTEKKLLRLDLIKDPLALLYQHSVTERIWGVFTRAQFTQFLAIMGRLPELNVNVVTEAMTAVLQGKGEDFTFEKWANMIGRRGRRRMFNQEFELVNDVDRGESRMGDDLGTTVVGVDPGPDPRASILDMPLGEPNPDGTKAPRLDDPAAVESNTTPPKNSAQNLTSLERRALIGWLGAKNPSTDGKINILLESQADRAREGLPASGPEFDQDLADILPYLNEFVEAVFVTRRGPEWVDAHVNADFLKALYVEAGSLFGGLVQFSQPKRAPYYRASEAEIARTYSKVIERLTAIGVDVQIFQQTMREIQSEVSPWGATISRPDGHRTVVLNLASIFEPTSGNLKTLLHEAAHIFVKGLPVWQQREVYQALERWHAGQQHIFRTSTDARLRPGNPSGLPPIEFMEELLVEHLATSFMERDVARSLVRQILDFIRATFQFVVDMLSSLVGKPVSPALRVKALDVLFEAFIDGKLDSLDSPATVMDLEPQTQDARARFFRLVDGGYVVENYDPVSGKTVPVDTVLEDTAAVDFTVDAIRRAEGAPLGIEFKHKPSVFEPPSENPYPTLSWTQPVEVPLSRTDLINKYPEVFTHPETRKLIEESNQQPVEIRTASGELVPGIFNGYYELTPTLTRPSMAYWLPEGVNTDGSLGGWTHTMLHTGDEILTPVPTLEQWKAGVSVSFSQPAAIPFGVAARNQKRTETLIKQWGFELDKPVPLVDALSRIAATQTDPNAAALITELQRMLKLLPVTSTFSVASTEPDFAREARGSFFSDKAKNLAVFTETTAMVAMNPFVRWDTDKFITTLLHETVHAVTLARMNRMFNHAVEISEGKVNEDTATARMEHDLERWGMGASADRILKDMNVMNNFYTMLKSLAPKDTDIYALSHIVEFVTEISTNKQARRDLRDILLLSYSDSGYPAAEANKMTDDQMVAALRAALNFTFPAKTAQMQKAADATMGDAKVKWSDVGNVIGSIGHVLTAEERMAAAPTYFSDNRYSVPLGRTGVEVQFSQPTAAQQELAQSPVPSAKNQLEFDYNTLGMALNSAIDVVEELNGGENIGPEFLQKQLGITPTIYSALNKFRDKLSEEERRWAEMGQEFDTNALLARVEDATTPIQRSRALTQVYKLLERLMTKILDRRQSSLALRPKLEKKREVLRSRVERFEAALADVAVQREEAIGKAREIYDFLRNQLNTNKLIELGVDNSVSQAARRLLTRGGSTARTIQLLDRILKSADRGSFRLVDGLTAIARTEGVNLNEDSVEDILNKVRTRDPKAALFSDEAGDSAVFADLAVNVAKLDPDYMAVLQLKTMEAGQTKTDLIEAARLMAKMVRESTTEQLNLLRGITNERIKNHTQFHKLERLFADTQRKLRLTNKQLQQIEERGPRWERAVKSLQTELSRIEGELGISDRPFEFAHGSLALLARSDGTVRRVRLDMKSKNFNKQVGLIILRNQKWLKSYTGPKDVQYRAILEQQRKLAIGLADNSKRQVQSHWGDAITKSIPNRLRTIGTGWARRIAARWDDYYQRIFGQRAMVEKEGKDNQVFLGEALRATGLNFDRFSDHVIAPAYRFIETNPELATAGADAEQQVARALRTFFIRNPATQQFVNTEQKFNAVFAFLKNNARVSERLANLAQSWDTLIEDESIHVRSMRTGKRRSAFRPAQKIGYWTVQRTSRNIGAVEVIMRPMWSQVAEEDLKLSQPVLQQLFSEEIKELFVKPLVYDPYPKHFPSPARPNATATLNALPENVREAWETAEGDMLTFIVNLYRLETNGAEMTEEGALVYGNQILTMMHRKYNRMRGMIEEGDRRADKWINGLPHQIMDARKAEDFPAELMAYQVYDQTSIGVIVNQLAAHAALGRDLGRHADGKENTGLLWEMGNARDELNDRISGLQTVRAKVRQGNPTIPNDAVDKEAKKIMGADAFNSAHDAEAQIRIIEELRLATVSLFQSQSSPTRDAQLPLEAVRTLAGFAVNNLKTTIMTGLQIFDPIIFMGLNRTSVTRVARTIGAVMHTGFGTMLQAVGIQLESGARLAQLLKEGDINQDPGYNFQGILMDPGIGGRYSHGVKNKVLGSIRKFRNVVLDASFSGLPDERSIYPRLRPLGIFGMGTMIVNHGTIMGAIRTFEDLISSGLKFLGPDAGKIYDPRFKFKAGDLGYTGGNERAYNDLTEQLGRMGTTLEQAVRDALEMRANGETRTLLTPDLTRRVSAMATAEVSLESNPSITPAPIYTNPTLQLIAPLLTWGLNRIHQLSKGFRDPNGEASVAAFRAGMFMLLFGLVPIGLLYSLLLDEVDETLFSKKSNLMELSVDAPVEQNALATLERLARVGTFGLTGDVANGLFVYGSQGDLRGLSLDNRILLTNSVQNLLGLVSTLYHQKGTVTYQSFGRQLINSLGGTGVIQTMQLTNTVTNGLLGEPLFETEAAITSRLSSLNYLRGVGRALHMDVRLGSGVRSLPNPLRPHVANMALAAETDQRNEFLIAYREAVNVARAEGQEEPEKYVLRSFQTYHPLRYVFRTPPTEQEYRRILSSLSESGQASVRDAVENFNEYVETLGGKPYLGRVERKGDKPLFDLTRPFGRPQDLFSQQQKAVQKLFPNPFEF